MSFSVTEKLPAPVSYTHLDVYKRQHPEYGPDYYAAFVIDPDGYRIEAVIVGSASLSRR